MMDALVDHAAGKRLVVEVMADNAAARAFLGKCGFQPTDRNATLTEETGLAALVMERPPR